VFSVDDLFTAGIGFDLVGAILVAKGLLVSAKQQWRRNASGYGGWSGPQAVSWAEDSVDGWFGAVALVLGFTLQAVAYALLIGGASVHIGTGAAWVAVASAAAAVAIVLAGWYLFKPRLVRFRAVALASADSPSGEPDGYLLTFMARELGRDAQSIAGVPTVLRDVFGVTSYSLRDPDELERAIHNWQDEKSAAP
jgi:hypothetical protein